MFPDKYFSQRFFANKYFPPGSILVTFNGAYAIIVTYKPGSPDLIFDQLRGITVSLDKQAIAESADTGVIETIGRTSVISGGITGSTIERVK